MQKKKLISSALLLITVILPNLFPWDTAIAQNKRKTPSTSLLKGKCVKSGIGSARQQKRDVSIGKAVYSSKFYLGPGYRSAALTCKIKPKNRPQNVFQTLNLGFGMRDNNNRYSPSPGVQVRLYFDGRLGEIVNINPAQAANISVNVINVDNVAIEATCSSSTRYCSRVYFYNADLLHKTSTNIRKRLK